MKYIVISCFLFFSVNSFGQNDTLPKPRKIKERPKTESVSIVSLLANPEKYKGKNVTIAGYMSAEFEGTAIYLSREDFDHRIRENAIFLLIGKGNEYQHYHKEYVRLDGTFYIGGGHMGAYNGVLDDVSYIQKLD